MLTMDVCTKNVLNSINFSEAQYNHFELLVVLEEESQKRIKTTLLPV